MCLARGVTSGVGYVGVRSIFIWNRFGSGAEKIGDSIVTIYIHQIITLLRRVLANLIGYALPTEYMRIPLFTPSSGRVFVEICCILL